MCTKTDFDYMYMTIKEFSFGSVYSGQHYTTHEKNVNFLCMYFIILHIYVYIGTRYSVS